MKRIRLISLIQSLPSTPIRCKLISILLSMTTELIDVRSFYNEHYEVLYNPYYTMYHTACEYSYLKNMTY